MAHSCSKDEVAIELGNDRFFLIFPERDAAADTLLELTEEFACLNSEERVQLQEGNSYEYELPEGYELEAVSGIVHPSRRKKNKHRGRLTPGIYVGRLALTILSPEDKSHQVAVEVRSTKADYRSEYRRMLEDITAECTELLMLHSSPVTQGVTPDYKCEPKTLYQRFAFVQSVVDSDEFRNAVHRVISMPVTSWAHKNEETDVRRSRRIGPKQIRQMASRSDRINLPPGHPLYSRMKSVPSRLSTVIKTDTVDTPENRFVKYALKEFERFCGVICQHIEEKFPDRLKRPHIYSEAKDLENRFSEYLSHSMFHEVSAPSALPLNSPILQRKEGYRKILRVWLMYDLAAKLVWNATHSDSYNVGKRDVATLYEYWLFFKLLRLIEGIFEIDAKETEKLIKETGDGLGLQLRAGRHTAIRGDYRHKGRDLKIQFNYNRTFGRSEYPASGSWTQQMRPDYTLSLWPIAFSETEAEEQELIVHVHFDAKYKVEGLEYLTSEDNADLSEEERFARLTNEKELQKQGTYKRADLLKMHAYKDAIRRTVGAYVLYPGTESYNCLGFHEIVPGLGAFPVSPSDNGNDLKAIREFIYEIINHFSNRASQREQLSYHQYDIHKTSKAPDVHEVIPEYNSKGKNRTKPPSESTVLIGYYNDDQYKWIESRGLYNIRLDSKGLIKYGPNETGAEYLLLHGRKELETSRMWEIVSDAPEFITKEDLLKKKGYPRKPSCDNYLIYKIKPFENDSFGGKKWDIRKLPGYSSGHASARPFAVTLADLSKAIILAKN